MSRDRTTSNGRRRADERRVANGQLPKPSPKHLRCIAEANEPKDYERRATTAPSERARKEDHRQRPHKLRIKPNFTLDQAYVDMVMRQVGKANIATYIDERLHSGRGSTCSYRSQALISGLAISAHQLGSVRWTDVTKTLAAFPPQIRYYFGLTSMHVGENVDYRSARASTAETSTPLTPTLEADIGPPQTGTPMSTWVTNPTSLAPLALTRGGANPTSREQSPRCPPTSWLRTSRLPDGTLPTQGSR